MLVGLLFVGVAAALAGGAMAVAQTPNPTPNPTPATATAADSTRSTAPAAGADSLPAPAAADSLPRQFNLRRAGKAKSFLENGERVTVLEDGVTLESEGTTIDSRRARIYRERERAFFYDDVVVHDRDVVMRGDSGEFSRPDDTAALQGHVRITDPRGVIRAERARYWRTTRLIWLWGQVDFKDEKTRVQADSVLYHEDTGVGEAFGHVVLTDLESGTEARGPHAFYDRNTSTARLDNRVHLVLRESGKADVDVEADESDFDKDKRIMKLRGAVHITRGDTEATSDSAFLYRDRDRVELRGHPWLRQQDTRIVGREIDVHYHDDKVERVEVRHEAEMVQARTDTLLIPGPNTVRGDSAHIYFTDGILQRAVVVGNAVSRYVPQESKPNRISVNEAQADSVVMLFENEEVQEVVFTGNASGTYRYFEGDLAALRQPVEARFDSTFGVVRGDTTRFDFQRRAEAVVYSAERILYLAVQNDLLLQKAAEVQYGSRTLRAGRIRYDADTDLLDASERPVLDDAGDRMYGDTMDYSMQSKNAWVEGASTQYDQGYYSGQVLRKTAEGDLLVAHGSYSTCDLARPHYRFECDEMKIILKEKVVGRPVRLYLGNVPVGWLPFLYNSVNTDRHSGFLQPDVEFGIFGQGRYIRALQYYWAASPYFDVLVGGDYTERNRPDRSTVGTVLRDTSDSRSVGLRLDGRYKLRYNFDGNLSYYTRRDFFNDSRYWSLSGSHNQTVGERATLRGNLDYASSSQALRRVYDNVDLARALQRQLTSTLSLNRPGDLVSFNATLQRKQLLDPDDSYTGPLTTSTLPQLSVSFRSIRLAPAPRPGHDAGLQGFLHSLELRPQFNYSRQTSENRVAVQRPKAADPVATPRAPGLVDSAEALVVGPGASALEFATTNTELVTASTGASLGKQVHAWIFNVSPSVSYSERYLKDSANPAAKRHSRTLGTGLGAATTFYGLFHPNRWGVTALRHRIDPSANVSYIPEIGGQQRRSTVVGLRLSNTIDAKIRRGKEERRVDGLFDWSLATTYNPTIMGRPAIAAVDSTIPALAGEPDRKFGNINSTITINRSGRLNMTISQTYDPYRGRILDTRIPFGIRLSGKFDYGDIDLERERRNRVVEEEGEAPGDSAAVDSTLGPGARTRYGETEMDPLETPGTPRSAAGTLGWELGLSYLLVRNINGPEAQRVGVSFSVKPTRNWLVAYRTSYDGSARTFVNPDIRVTRELHCWRATFSRVQYAGEWRYYFRIYVDRHQQDLFFESGDRALGGY